MDRLIFIEQVYRIFSMRLSKKGTTGWPMGIHLPTGRNLSEAVQTVGGFSSRHHWPFCGMKSNVLDNRKWVIAA
jgi:hypothetical protein